jgi:CLASP N terminal
MQTYKTSKVSIRSACTQIVMRLMKLADPSIILKDILFTSCNEHEHYRVKIEAYNIVTLFLITFPKKFFDVDLIMDHLKLGLNSDQVKVKYHALEACAVLASKVRPRDIAQMLESPDLVHLIKSRTEDQRLPYVNLEGGLEHIVSSKLSNRKSSLSEISLLKEDRNHDVSYSAPPKISSIKDLFGESGKQEMNDIEDAFNKIAKISSDFGKSLPSEPSSSLSTLNLPDEPEPAPNKFVPIKKKKMIQIKKEVELDEMPLIRATEPNQEETEDMQFDTAPAPTRKLSIKPRKVVKVKQPEVKPPPAAVEKANLEKKLRDVLIEIKDTDWSIVQKALGDLTAFIPIHVNWVSANIGEITLSTTTQVQNLRSSVAKVAILAVAAIFRELPKQALEPHLDAYFRCLLKKVGEGNSFILEAIDETLDAMCENSSMRAILALMSSSNARNALIRMRVSVLVDKIISNQNPSTLEKMIKSQKDAEKIFPGLVSFLGEGLVDTRNGAKHALYVLSKVPEFETRLPKILNIMKLGEVKDMLRNYVAKEKLQAPTPTSALRPQGIPYNDNSCSS